MSYSGPHHPHLYDNLSEKEKEQISILDGILHRRPTSNDISTNLEANNDAVTSNDVLLADDSSSSDDEQNDTKATTSLLKEKGLFFERPIILQDGLRDEFQGRQVISNLFNILEENKRIDVEEANKPPPAYYWTPGHEEKYSDLSAWGRVKHNLHWIGYKTFWGIAFAGEVAINILGLDQPEYHWMLQEAEKDKQKLDEQKRFQAQRRAYLLHKKLAADNAELSSSSSDSEYSDLTSSDDEEVANRRSTRRGGLKNV